MGYALEQVDLLRERMGVGYEAARDALDESGGDTVEALVLIERKQAQECAEARLEHIANRIVEEVRQTLMGRPITSLRVKLDGWTVKEVPVALAGVGAVLVTLLSSLLAHLRLETVVGGDADERSETDGATAPRGEAPSPNPEV